MFAQHHDDGMITSTSSIQQHHTKQKDHPDFSSSITTTVPPAATETVDDGSSTRMEIPLLQPQPAIMTPLKQEPPLLSATPASSSSSTFFLHIPEQFTGPPSSSSTTHRPQSHSSSFAAGATRSPLNDDRSGRRVWPTAVPLLHVLLTEITTIRRSRTRAVYEFSSPEGANQETRQSHNNDNTDIENNHSSVSPPAAITVLELGAGCGVVGLGLATYNYYQCPHHVRTSNGAMGSRTLADDIVEQGKGGVALVDHVIVTDQDISWLNKSVNANPTWFTTASTTAATATTTTNDEDDQEWLTVGGGGLLTVKKLEWGDTKRANGTMGPVTGTSTSTTIRQAQGLDYIVGSDLLYNPDSYDALLSTIGALASKKTTTTGGTQILLAYPERPMVVGREESSSSSSSSRMDRGDVVDVRQSMGQQGKEEEDRAARSASRNSRCTTDNGFSTTDNGFSTTTTTTTKNTTELFSQRVHAHESFRIVSVQDLWREARVVQPEVTSRKDNGRGGGVEPEEDSTKYTLMRLIVQQQ